MKTSTTQARNYRPTISKIMMPSPMRPALAEDHDDRHGHRDNGWHEGRWHGDRDDRRGYQHRYYYQQPYYYSRPVYSPPPVYYAPQPSPGINLVFPIDIR